jgi:hypothetical protein
MRTFLLLFLLCPAVFAGAQQFRYPAAPSKGKTVAAFIPAGWEILDSASGDLNKDTRTDFALVLQHKTKKQLIKKDQYTTDTVITNPRMLLLLFADSSGYKLMEQNNTFVPTCDQPPNVMDDPFGDISIRKGVIKIDIHYFYYMGSWNVSSYSYKFRYQDNAFALIGADCSDFHRASHDFTDCSFNFLTKKWSLKTGNESNAESSTKTTWHTLELQELKTLGTFKQPFTWNVVDGVVL